MGSLRRGRIWYGLDVVLGSHEPDLGAPYSRRAAPPEGGRGGDKSGDPSCLFQRRVSRHSVFEDLPIWMFLINQRAHIYIYIIVPYLVHTEPTYLKNS